jgi:hypothetical protein
LAATAMSQANGVLASAGAAPSPAPSRLPAASISAPHKHTQPATAHVPPPHPPVLLASSSSASLPAQPAAPPATPGTRSVVLSPSSVPPPAPVADTLVHELQRAGAVGMDWFGRNFVNVRQTA